MAGMDWFRWHHGSVTDPKFQLVAKKSGASVAEVIAVWATILEAASMAEERGSHGELDFESMDCALGLDDGMSKVIHGHMTGRGLIDDGRVSSWDKRQPKREREDNTSAERQRTHRAVSHHVTPDNAESHQKTPRVEKSREEKNKDSVAIATGDKSPKLTDPDDIIFGYGVPMLTNAGTSEKQARSFLGGLRKNHGDDALIDKLRECAKAKPLQPLEWLAAVLPPKGAPPKANAQETLEASNRAVVQRFLAKESQHVAQ